MTFSLHVETRKEWDHHGRTKYGMATLFQIEHWTQSCHSILHYFMGITFHPVGFVRRFSKQSWSQEFFNWKITNEHENVPLNPCIFVYSQFLLWFAECRVLLLCDMGWANFLGSLMDNNTDPNVAKAMQEGQILSLYCVFIPL